MNTSHYCPHTPGEIREMLDTIGVSSVEELFAPIPAPLRSRPLNLPDGVSEFEALAHLQSLADRNDSGLTLFIGAGYYDHLIPAAVDHLAGRAEFYTAYTPYQPECAQGTLQALYEYQTAICRLTALDVANASLYDGATAVAEAALMAMRVTNRSTVIVDGAVSPVAREVLATYLSHQDATLITLPPCNGGLDRQGLAAVLTDDTAALIVQYPNSFGVVDDLGGVAEQLHTAGALLVTAVYPISLGMLASPGEIGADIAVGDGQSLGNPLSFGGPSFGFIAAKKSLIRNMPGRIVGETVDREGRRGFVLTLQAREQHIKRHKATSNICSNQSLCALKGLIFLSAIGRDGLAELAQLNYDKAVYASEQLTALPGVSLSYPAPFFNEFSLTLPSDSYAIAEALLTRGIAAGVPGEGNRLVVTVTEKRTKAEIDGLVAALKEVLCN